MPGRRAAGVTVRNFSIPDPLFAAARDKAAAHGQSLAEVVRRLLAAYLTEPAVSEWVSPEMSDTAS